MTDRFIIDDAGTLIDIETRNTYDYVSEICPVLNRYDAILKTKNETIKLLIHIFIIILILGALGVIQ